jgi:hypothetical protein
MMLGMGEMRNPLKILIRKPVRKRPRGRCRRRWEDNIRMEIGLTAVDRIHLAQYMSQLRAFVSMVMSLRFP